MKEKEEEDGAEFLKSIETIETQGKKLLMKKKEEGKKLKL